jgi:hypothetical protein
VNNLDTFQKKNKSSLLSKSGVLFVYFKVIAEKERFLLFFLDLKLVITPYR